MMRKLFYIFILCSFTSVFGATPLYEEKYQVGQIKTPMGEILFWLYDETPNHKESFIKLATQHYWDTLTFNRVVKDFVIQGGCPDTPEGFSDSPYLLKPEFTPVARHVYGAVANGRDNNPDMLSAGCQIYIVQNREGEARLDDKYTVFGHVIQGMDIVDKIAQVNVDGGDQPYVPISLEINVIEMTRSQVEQTGFKIPSR